jgi:hypothetical protein
VLNYKPVVDPPSGCRIGRNEACLRRLGRKKGFQRATEGATAHIGCVQTERGHNIELSKFVYLGGFFIFN